MDIGTASARPGELTTGYLDVTELPTAGIERLPVVVAQGEEDGPTLWVTASIHGNELNGMAVAQDVMTDDLPEKLAGTVVCLPNLNPAGLRRNARVSYYRDDDPNRFFPERDPDRVRPPGVQELIDRQIYDEIVASADAVLSLHTAQVHSRAFIIRGRVPYGQERGESEARELADELDRLADAFGVPVVNQFPQDEYEERGLNRSLAGSLVDVAGIPAFTPELGGHSVVEEGQREAGVTGTYNVMRAMDMLPGDPVENDAAPADPVDYPVCRTWGPHTETPGIVRYRVETGDRIDPGDPVADVVTPHGDVKETVTAENEGYVVSRLEGAVAYENDPLLSLAVRDDEPLVVERKPE